MYKDLCKSSDDDDVCSKLPNLSSGMDFTAITIKDFIENNNNIKLEMCFPYIDTIQMLKTEYLQLPENIIFPNFKILYPSCCISINKEKKRKRDVEYNCIERDDLISNFSFKITDFKILFKYTIDLKEKNEINDKNLNAIQNNMKTRIACYNKPLLCKIITTNDYYSFIQNIKKTSSRVFVPSSIIKTPLEYNTHYIVIYGWTIIFDEEFWIVKDSNLPIEIEFYYIPFSTIGNKDKWIGCDIDWKEGDFRQISNYIICIDVEADIPDEFIIPMEDDGEYGNEQYIIVETLITERLVESSDI